MQQLIEERHALETRLERLEAAGGAAATPPMSDRREAGIFCSNNKSVFSLRISCITAAPLCYPPVLRIRIRDSGSGASLTPGYGIRNRFFPDPGYRIPDLKPIPIFESLVTIFWVKSSIIL